MTRPEKIIKNNLVVLKLAEMLGSLIQRQGCSSGPGSAVAGPPHSNPSTMHRLPRIRIVLYA